MSCLRVGGSQCKLNYEQSRNHSITVRVRDNGLPALEKDFTLAVEVEDRNDKPIHLTLSNFTVLDETPVEQLTYTVDPMSFFL